MVTLAGNNFKTRLAGKGINDRFGSGSINDSFGSGSIDDSFCWRRHRWELRWEASMVILADNDIDS